MRVAWCTPFSKESAIGEFSAAVVSEFRHIPGVEADILYPVGRGGRLDPDPGLPLDRTSEDNLGDYDVVFYNIGNHLGNHGDLVQVLRRVPGIVVLHDASLAHLVTSELLKLDEIELRRVFSRLYGARGVVAARDFRMNPGEWPWLPANVDNYPFLGLILESALGVVTHSKFAAAKVRREYVGDVWQVPMPSCPLPQLKAGGERVLSDFDDRPIVLQAGGVNRTKCVSTVIDAFHLAGISDRAQLVVCGFAEPEVLKSLRDQVARLGLSQSVRILGNLSDEELHFLRRRATLATVLRYPIAEAASKVLLDSMAYGLPVVTINAGHYVEVPDDTVFRVAYPPVAENVAEVLSYAISHPIELNDMAARGRLYLETQRSLSGYAKEVIRVSQEAGAISRRKGLAADLRETLVRLRVANEDRILADVSATVVELFGNQPIMAHEIYTSSVDTENI